jgi:cobalt-precorrin-5B (C1)-methyltransferase
MTAAAVAAAMGLKNQKIPCEVVIDLPKGRKLTIPILEGTIQKSVQTVVVKEAGDDPDVTNQARIGVRLEERDSGLTLVGGLGVGKVTKPGLVLPPGEWAINPKPRQYLAQNLEPYLRETGLLVQVFIQNGEKLALKTLNPRLGIVGGLSVLGTTGLVKPFSHAAYLATIDSALNVAKAMGLEEIILTTGGRSEELARSLRPDLPPEGFIQIADYFAAALIKAAKKRFLTIGLAVFFGKAVKQAAGYRSTHAHHNEMDLSLLAAWLKPLNPKVLNQIAQAPTALAALAVIKEERLIGAVEIVAQRIVAKAQAFTGPLPKIWATIFDFDGTILAQA